MGADDVAILLGPAIERAWLLGAPQFAPLAPLIAALLRGHMLQAFVPAYSEYTLAEDRRLIFTCYGNDTVQALILNSTRLPHLPQRK